MLALYFAPTWGKEALRVLLSPYSGFEDRTHAAVATYFRGVLDLSLDGMVRLANVLAGIELVIAAGFVAYLIEFARALLTGRDVNRETADVVLALAAAALLLWALPALSLDDPAVLRVYATQMMLVAGAVVVLIVERQIEHAAACKAPAVTVARAPERAPAPAIGRWALPLPVSERPIL